MLKQKSKSKFFAAVYPDIDNLCKFVMDALNGIVYNDDRQVVVLHAIKLRDSDGTCNGKTIVHVTQCLEKEYLDLL